MGVFAREKPRAAMPIPTPIDFQTASITVDELQRVVDDWKRAERDVRKHLASRGAQLWAQAQEAVAAHDREEFVRLGELMASHEDIGELDLRDTVFAQINKVQYTSSMLHIAEMMAVSQESNTSKPEPQSAEP